MICGAHFPFPGAGAFTKDGSRYAVAALPAPDAKGQTKEMVMRTSTLVRACGAALLAACILAGLISTVKAVDTPTTREAPDLTAVRTKIKAKEFKAAIADLNGMIDKGVQHTDVYNLLGFSLRKSGDAKTAYTFYEKALDFDAEHKGARIPGRALRRDR
jgi:hypothetical protein